MELKDNNNKTILKLFNTTVNSGPRPFREHHHTECEISLILSGCGTYSVGNKTYEFQSNDIFIFGSDEIHCITNILPNEPLSALVLRFEPRMLWETEFFCDVSLLNIFFSKNKCTQLDRNNKSIDTIKNLIIEIFNELKSKKSGYELLVRTKLVTVLVTVLRDFTNKKHTDSISSKSSSIQQLSKVIAHIDNNLDTEMSLSKLAKMCLVTPTYFSSLFKKYNGISPFEYISIKRIEKAIEYIKNTNMTKIEIAESCGFKSISNFYKTFKNVTGKMPKDYISDHKKVEL